ncbi:MAG TPA: putative PEP-binding protein, partial [Caulobacteraceae bacterium]
LASVRARKRSAQAAAHEDCRTADGVRIEVFANLASVAEAQGAAADGAEGCGLLRTEFLFLDRQTAPTEDEQAAQYQAIAQALAGRPVIIRTLDAGGDKPLAYLPLPGEENPALGLRGVRVGLWRPDLLKTQLRAILRTTPEGQCRIMLPMVSSLSELRAVRVVADEAAAELGLKTRPVIGIMVETPAAAVTADLLAAEADFLSIGTNDLSQYALAMDRTNAELAAQVDALHPAVLRLIGLAAEGGAKYGRMVAICGALASDLAAVPILLGLGVTELSGAASAVPEIKALVRTLTLDACRDLAARALVQTSAAEVRALRLTVESSLSTGARP